MHFGIARGEDQFGDGSVVVRGQGPMRLGIWYSVLVYENASAAYLVTWRLASSKVFELCMCIVAPSNNLVCECMDGCMYGWALMYCGAGG